MSGKALICVLIGLITGIFIGNLNFIPAWASIVPIATAILLFTASVFISKRNPFSLTPRLNLAEAILIFCGIGNFSSAINRPAATVFPQGKYEFSGKIIDYTPTGNGDKLLVSLSRLYIVREDSTLAPMKAENVNILTSVQSNGDIDYGKEIKGVATLKPVDSPSNYLNEDYVSFLKSKRIFLTGYMQQQMYAVANARQFPDLSIKRLRDKLEINIEKTRLQTPTKEFLISFLLGDKSYIRTEDRITFSDAGVSHIFAVSGFHVSLIALFVLTILSLFFKGKSRRWKFILCIPLIWFYVLLTGASPATCRAGLMISIGMAAFFLQRKNNAMLSLGWTVLIILSLAPRSLFDIGFQLSVICVGALLMIAQPLNFMRHRQHPRLYKIVSVVLITLTATFSVWIVCGYYFHKFSLMFLPLNLIAVPLLPLFILLSLLYIFLFGVGFNVSFLGKALDSGYSLFRESASLITSRSHVFENFHPDGVTVWLWLAGLAFFGYACLQLKQQGAKLRLWKLFILPVLFFAFSIISLPILAGRNLPEGFIIQKNNHEVALMNYNGGKEYLISMPETACSQTQLNGKKILALRSDNITPTIAKALGETDIILVCGGCKSLPPELCKQKKEGSMIVTHPSLHWRYERSMLAEAAESGIPVHSLRYDGPLHFFNP